MISSSMALNATQEATGVFPAYNLGFRVPFHTDKIMPSSKDGFLLGVWKMTMFPGLKLRPTTNQ